MLTRRKKGQSVAEYAILISLCVAAFMGIQNEVRRAIQARVHDAAVELTQGGTWQYEPSAGVKTTTNQKSERIKDENWIDKGDVDSVYQKVADTNSADYKSDETK
ncbi:MAG: hypothetical protein WCI77_05595 [Candidatus Omnitrophota bacterium]